MHKANVSRVRAEEFTMVYDAALLEIAKDYRTTNYLRVLFLAMAYLGHDGGRVLVFETGELSSMLLCPSRKEPGRMVPMGQQVLSRAIRDGISLGYLSEGSKPRRIEVTNKVVRSRIE